MRLLVVDDNRDTALALVRILGVMGHTAQAVHDGAQALDLISRTLGLDGYIIDQSLGPHSISGTMLVEHLRATNDRTPCVLITGHTGDELEAIRMRVGSLGRVAFLQKPFSEERLIAELEAMK